MVSKGKRKDSLDGSASDSDEAPEAVSLKTSKEDAISRRKLIQLHDAEYVDIGVYEAALISTSNSRSARKTKESNKSRDAAFKARKDAQDKTKLSKGAKRPKARKPRETSRDTRSPHHESEPNDAALRRMERAMEDAQDESSDDADDGDAWGGVEDENQERNVFTSLKGSSGLPTPDYLPDSVFAAAAKSTKRRFSEDPDEDDLGEGEDHEFDSSRHRRRRTEPEVRDVIVGSRTVRPIPVVNQIGSDIAMRRSLKDHKTMKRMLNKDGRELRSWQRMKPHLAYPSNTNGPARNFVQSQMP
ncbi:hypothetical protein FRB99_005374 [Tulasnella sp. 403]|nr:hypothetical protein FRB99_005374 [Tulasnella sp. 403]